VKTQIDIILHGHLKVMHGKGATKFITILLQTAMAGYICGGKSNLWKVGTCATRGIKA
jgi:hypothetical protein